jgi:DNA (cytosine-5)-methyltransferase 1
MFRVVELFAGVGGFRLGLEASGPWDVLYSNQWEPSRKRQWASDCYRAHFTTGVHTNMDIAAVDASTIPDHDLLVGGFPCQDYSVASSSAQGIEGKKGVLWWEILRIVKAKMPQSILLENVDRLLKSPSKQRGRDFAIILSSLNALGYTVEWRVVNAADYGFPQRRRRVFIFASLDGERVFDDVFGAVGMESTFDLPQDLLDVSNNFTGMFLGAGVSERFVTNTGTPSTEGEWSPLSSVLESDVGMQYYIRDIKQWEYLKGAKKELRTTREGFTYEYSEGAIPFPDPLDRPSRTILTTEGGRNRASHVVLDKETMAFRTLTETECERLMGFPDGWTNTGMPKGARYFCMGNAVVVGLVEMIGRELVNRRS